MCFFFNFLACLFMVFNFILTTTSLAMLHERVPDRTVYGPLPDVVLDNVEAQDWALDVSEVLIVISSNAAMIFIIFHKHRSVENKFKKTTKTNNIVKNLTFFFSFLQIYHHEKNIYTNGYTIYDEKYNILCYSYANVIKNILL